MSEINWTQPIKAGVYPVSSIRHILPPPPVTEYVIEHDFVLSETPVKVSLFRQFIEETVFNPQIALSKPPDDILSSVYCTDIPPFLRWLNDRYRAELEGWMIDLPTEGEWVTGFNHFYPDGGLVAHPRFF